MPADHNDEVAPRLLGFGELRVVDDTGPRRVPGARERAVLAFLMARRGRSTAPDEIVAALWGDDIERTAAIRSLRVRITNLRKALRPLDDTGIESTAAGYELSVAPNLIDLAVFERSIEHAASLDPAAVIPHLQRALRLYTAVPLQEFQYEDWARPLIRHYEELRLTAVDGLGEGLVSVGNEGDAVPLLHEAHHANPERESTTRALMRALAAAGRPSEGLTAFARTAAALGERGLEPAEETKALEAELLTGAAPRPPRPTPNLPAREPLVGRDAELAEVDRLVTDHRLVTVVGPGGVGKTRLAVEAGHRAAERYAGGVHFVDFSGVDDGDVVDAAFARILGIRPEPGRSLRATMAESLADLSMLVIADNCEHVGAAAADLIGHLIDYTDRVHVLATSRARLEVFHERSFPLEPLRVPEAGADAEAVFGSPAVTLFVDRALRATGRRPSADQAPDVARLVVALDGLPLAIELAAARSAALTPAQMADRLDQRFELLRTTTGGRTPRHQALEATLDWSHDLLDADAAIVLRRLGVFRGGCTLEAAEQVCGGEPLAGGVAEALARLVDHSLVQVTDGQLGRRCDLLESVRHYARRRLATAGESREVATRHLHWIADLADELAADTTEEGMFARFARLDTEIDNLRQAFSLALTVPEPALATRLAAQTYFWWYRRGAWAEGSTWLERTIREAFSEADPRRAARALTGAGSMALSGRGDVAAAEDYWRRELELTERTNLRRPYNNLSMVYSFAGEWEQATELLELAVRQQRDLGEDAWLELANLGGAYLALGRYEEAERALDESDADAAHFGFEDSNHAVHSRAELALIRGDRDEAARLAEAGLARWERAGISLEHQMSLRHVLARIALAEGDPGRAAVILTAATDRSVGLGGPLVEHLIVWAAVAVAVGDDDTAATLLGTAAERNPRGRALPVAIASVAADVTAAAEAGLGGDYDEAFERGRSLTPAQALDLAVTLAPRPAAT